MIPVETQLQPPAWPTDKTNRFHTTTPSKSARAKLDFRIDCNSNTSFHQAFCPFFFVTDLAQVDREPPVVEVVPALDANSRPKCGESSSVRNRSIPGDSPQKWGQNGVGPGRRPDS